jgi:hypothetical protein
VLSPVSIDALSKMSLIAVDSVSDVASSPPVSVDSVSVSDMSSPVSVDPLAYIIAVADKNNEDIIKSNSKLVIWFNIPFLVAVYISVYPYE